MVMVIYNIGINLICSKCLSELAKKRLQKMQQHSVDQNLPWEYVQTYQFQQRFLIESTAR